MSNIYKTRLKLYPNGTSEYVEFNTTESEIVVLDEHKFRPGFKNKLSNSQTTISNIPFYGRSDDLSQLQVLSRRKARVRDYTLSGNFAYFGTLTFRPSQASRTVDEIRDRLKLFTRRLRRRNVSYYIVAETHKSGYIHLHGLFSDNVPFEYSPVSKKYFSIPLWDWGFSSIEHIRDQTATAHYVTKYVTKEAIKGRSVWVSQRLKKPIVLYNTPDLLTPLISEWYSPNVNVTLRGH